MPRTSEASIAGGRQIEYFAGEGQFYGRRVEGFHVLRIFGDVTQGPALRAAIEEYRLASGFTAGPTILHSPLGPVAEWPAPHRH